MTTTAIAPALTEESIRALCREANEPDWLLKARLDALRAYDAMVMPSPLEEEWRRTDLSGFDLDAALANGSPAKPLKLPRDYQSAKGFGAVMQQIGSEPVDIQRALELPEGLVFTSLQQAAIEYPDLVREHLYGLVPASDWKLAALNAAAWQGGAFIYLPRGVQATLPLRLVLAQAGGPALPRLLIITEDESSLTLVQDTYSAGQAQSLASGAIEIFCGPYAKVRFAEVQRWGGGLYNFSTIRARLDRGAELSASLIGLGARLTKTKLEVSLEGEGSSADLLGLSFGEHNQHFDYVTMQDHIAPRTSSDLLFKAALTDSSSEVWYGTVHIRKGASQSQANQTSRNMLLSNHAKAAPIPVLEIEAYDILKCSHGATAGPLDEEQRFYLESRGIPPVEAQRLLVDAFFRQVVDRIPVPEIKQQLEKALAGKIEGSARRGI